MAFRRPCASDFKSRFDRDFGFSADQTDMEHVRDVDICRAFNQAEINFNEGLFGTLQTFTEAFMLLSAHFLCVNLLNSSQGLGGAGTWLTNSKAVGNVTESFSIPDKILRDPFLAMYSKTSYGMTYLQLIMPLLVGNVMALHRESLAV